VADATTMGCWTAGGTPPGHINQYIQVDLESTKVITMVATQGRQDSAQWVTKYAISYSQDGSHWIDYKGDCIQVKFDNQ